MNNKEMNNKEMEFFTATEQLAAVHDWARARYAAPWAVLGGVLIRVAANTPAYVQLPGVIGGRASLNVLAAFAGPSGSGKGVSDAVARLAYPTQITELPIGTGQGIAETFRARNGGDGEDDPDRITAAIFTCGEIDALTGLSEMKGSILLASLKSLAMGEQLGQTLGTKGASRLVPAHSYRACLTVGAQPGHTDVIFTDATGGTPQRFLWWRTTDPDMPADTTPEPAPLDTTPPRWHMAGGVAEIVYGIPEIRETIIAALLARQRGNADALDGHAILTRCKVAALLAIMHGSQEITELFWRLSGAVMAHSNATREWLLAEAKRISREKSQERAIAQGAFQVAREKFVDDAKAGRARSSILRWLGQFGDENGEMATGDILKRARSNVRDYYKVELRNLVAERQIIARNADHGGRKSTRYRLVDASDQMSTNGRVSTDQNRRSEPVDTGGPVDTSDPRESAMNPHQPGIQSTGPGVSAKQTEACVECHITLPASARGDHCEDCADGGWLRPTDPADEPPRPMHVVHSGADEAGHQFRHVDNGGPVGMWRRSGQPVEGGAA